ncbi:hypothetical protein Pve01_93290 [Planomonospora venezuelensis]|nr:hypothetical protein Pve01_93290 [Planomonospora venezuelensis]
MPGMENLAPERTDTSSEVVGVAELELPLSENTDVARTEVQVLPTHRRRGIGRALWQAVVERARAGDRTRVGGEVTVDVADPGPGRAFAAAMGTVDKHREDHLVADLPVPVSGVDEAYDVAHERRGEVVDDEVAEVLELLGRRAAPRTRHAGDDDELSAGRLVAGHVLVLHAVSTHHQR